MQLFNKEQYLLIDVANNYGLDKLSWNERIDWAKSNLNNLENLANKADAPCMYRCSVKALRDHYAGIPSGYGIHLDASASGTQWLSILTGDRSGAKLCNVLNTGKREDSYTIIHKAILEESDTTSNITREQVKKAIMTSLYGSTKRPKELFGKDLPIFEKVMSKYLPEAWLFNKALSGSAWDPTANSYHWVLPDNFHAGFKVKALVQHEFTFKGNTVPYFVKEQMPQPRGRALGANLIHSIDGFIVREMVQRCSFSNNRAKEVISGSTSFIGSTEDILQCLTLWNLYKESGFLSARILNYIYANTINLVDRTKIEELLNELPKKTFDILPIHDSFTALPAYGNDVRQQYIYLMYHMAKSNMINFLGHQIGIQAEWVKPEDFSEEILNSEYALS